jgi:hypothetical protein
MIYADSRGVVVSWYIIHRRRVSSPPSSIFSEIYFGLLFVSKYYTSSFSLLLLSSIFVFFRFCIITRHMNHNIVKTPRENINFYSYLEENLKSRVFLGLNVIK